MITKEDFDFFRLYPPRNDIYRSAVLCEALSTGETIKAIVDRIVSYYPRDHPGEENVKMIGEAGIFIERHKERWGVE